MPKTQKWELQRIAAHERQGKKGGDIDQYLCVWEDSVLNSLAAVEEERQSYELEYTQRDDGKYVVTWAPTWEPAWKIRRDAYTRVREWRERNKKNKIPPTTSNVGGVTPHIVPDNDSDSDSNSSRSSHSPEPHTGPVMEFHRGPRTNYFVKSITNLDPDDAEKGGMIPSCPQDSIIEHAKSATAVIDAELQDIFDRIREGPH